jgi:PKD repeat protein
VSVTATSAPNVPPTAVAAATPASGFAPLPVSFSAAGSVDPDGSITSYAWSFGDGSTGSGLTTSHTYTSTGTYTATLTVTDNRGATATKTVTITATANPNLIFAPTDLLGSAVRGGNVTLAWNDNSDNETGFSVERAPSGASTYAVVGTAFANATSFSQSGVARGKYVYRVRAGEQHHGRVLGVLEPGLRQRHQVVPRKRGTRASARAPVRSRMVRTHPEHDPCA